MIRVLVVDDSAIIRAIIGRALTQDPLIEVIGTAVDGIDALTKIRSLRPDVVTLDVEMPRLNGIGVLERVVGKAPVNFLMVSTLTQVGARVTFEALQKGAVDYIAKPTAAGKAAYRSSRPSSSRRCGRPPAHGPAGVSRRVPPRARRQRSAQPGAGFVVAIGISCGGPQTLHQMLPAFPSDFVPIVLTQHMPAQFTGPFAQHLDRDCAMNVREARDGEPLEQGTILVAPGDRHLKIVRRGAHLYTALDAGPLVTGHRPSVDVMFKSLAAACGPRAIGVIMTGMGRDGAEGIVELSKAGAYTIGQDEETSYVYGMPKAAAATGCLDHVAPLPQIPAMVARLLTAPQKSVVAVR
jgi:two-component system chemotaxis response regulator CheB